MGKKIVVVGGVAGGASFAARMRRLDEDAEIVLFEKGNFISFANCGLPYHIGNTIKNRQDLIIQTPAAFTSRFRVDVRLGSEVVEIQPLKNSVTVRSETQTYQESYDYLLLSPGSTPLRPPMQGIDSNAIFTLRTIPDMDRIIDAIKNKPASRAVVVGGGFIGLEMAENLRHLGLEVALVEMLDQVFAPADIEMAQIIHQHLTINGIQLYLKAGVKEFVPTGDDALSVVLADGRTLLTDIVILAIGVKPDTSFLKNSAIRLNQRGAIIVNDRMQTNFENILAVGDAVEVIDFVSGKPVMVPLAGPANRQGRIAADTVAGIESHYKQTQGTAICKIFSMTAAVTGLNERNAKKYGIAYKKSYTHSASHAGYYPGAYPMSIKILFDPQSGMLLGAQIVGTTGVDKRIDVLATALRHHLTVFDLSELELAYAPPYGSAKDPVNMAGFVAENIMKGKVDVFYADEVSAIDPGKQLLLDVRTREENETASIPQSYHIPVDELRNRIGELDPAKEIFCYCQIGLRGYIASRILTQRGFRVRNLSGGYKTYSHSQTIDYDSSYTKPLQEKVCSTPTEQPGKSIIVDACGMQCPGPIMKLAQAIASSQDGDQIEIRATDMGFSADVASWCTKTKNSLISLAHDDGTYTAIIKKGAPKDICNVPQSKTPKKTFVIFSNDLDKIMAAFIIANAASSMGNEVSLFFTFWGLNLLRRSKPSAPVHKTLMEKMFGMMMPKGPGKVSLSKMNMAGLGTMLMRGEMKKKNVFSLEELMEQAIANKIRFIACAMSMEVMGIKKEELIDGVELGGVAYYLEQADNSAYNLFI